MKLNVEITFNLLKKSNSYLEDLSLKDRHVRSAIAKELITNLLPSKWIYFENLTYLEISSSNLDAESSYLLSQTLLKNDSIIEVLDIRNNNVGDEGTKSLSNFFSSSPNLKVLNISSNNIGTKGAQALSEALLVNQSLTILHLGNNTIGNEGVIFLSKSLLENITLTELDLWHANVGDEGIMALSNALSTNQTIKKLNLGFWNRPFIDTLGIFTLSHLMLVEQANKTPFSILNDRTIKKTQEKVDNFVLILQVGARAIQSTVPLLSLFSNGIEKKILSEGTKAISNHTNKQLLKQVDKKLKPQFSLSGLKSIASLKHQIKINNDISLFLDREERLLSTKGLQTIKRTGLISLIHRASEDFSFFDRFFLKCLFTTPIDETEDEPFTALRLLLDISDVLLCLELLKYIDYEHLTLESGILTFSLAEMLSDDDENLFVVDLLHQMMSTNIENLIDEPFLRDFLYFLPENITYLTLKDLGLNNNDIRVIAEYLKDCSFLLYLSLTGNCFNELAWGYLNDALKKNSALEYLDISNNQIKLTQTSLNKFLEKLEDNPDRYQVNLIDISGNYFARTCKSVLQSQNMFFTLPKALPSVFDVLEPGLMLTHEYWQVMLASNKSMTGDHAFIIIEGMYNFGQRVLIRCELTASSIVGSAEIITRPYDAVRLKKSLMRGRYQTRLFSNRSRTKAKLLKESIEEEETRGAFLRYCKYGIKTGKTQNCISWAIEKLIEWEIPDQQEQEELNNDWLAKVVPAKGAGGDCSLS